MLLLPGAYRLRLRLERDGGARWLPGLLQASVYAWPHLLARRYPVLGPGGRDIVLDFAIPAAGGQPFEAQPTQGAQAQFGIAQNAPPPPPGLDLDAVFK